MSDETQDQLDQEKLFADISRSLREEDASSKVTELLEVKTEEPQVEEPVSAVVPTTTPTETPDVPATTTSVETPPSTEPVVPDWESSLPDEAKQLLKSLREDKAAMEHKIKSELGRVPFLQRKVDELSRQLSRTVPVTTPVTPAAADPAKPSKFAQRLAQIKEIDPVLAETLEAMAEDIVAPLKEDVTKEINQTRAILQEKEEDELWVEQKSKLLEAVPNADDVFAHPMYREWKAKQSENIQRLAGSIYADEVIVALKLFAEYANGLSANGAPTQTQSGPASPAPSSTTPATQNPQGPATSTAKLVEDRNKKLGATTPPSKPPAKGTADDIPDDPDLLFAYYAKKLRNREL